MKRFAKLITITVVILLSMGALSVCMLWLIGATDTGQVKSLISANAEWRADIELEAYGTFGGATYTVFISPNRMVLGKFQREKVFVVESNSDGSVPLDIKWSGPEQLTIMLKHQPTSVCPNCTDPLSTATLKRTSVKTVSIQYIDL